MRIQTCATCLRFDGTADPDVYPTDYDCECVYTAAEPAALAEVESAKQRFLARCERQNRQRRERLGLPPDCEAPGLNRPGPRYCTNGHPVRCHPATLHTECRGCDGRNVEILPIGADAFLARAYELIEAERRFLTSCPISSLTEPGSLARQFADSLVERAIGRIERLAKLAAETRALIDAHRAIR